MKRKLMAFAAVLMLVAGGMAVASDGSAPEDDCILECCPPIECSMSSEACK